MFRVGVFGPSSRRRRWGHTSASGRSEYSLRSHQCQVVGIHLSHRGATENFQKLRSPPSSRYNDPGPLGACGKCYSALRAKQIPCIPAERRCSHSPDDEQSPSQPLLLVRETLWRHSKTGRMPAAGQSGRLGCWLHCWGVTRESLRIALSAAGRLPLPIKRISPGNASQGHP